MIHDIEKDQLLANVEALEKTVKSYKNHAKKLRADMEMIAERICDNEFAKKQLGGKNRLYSLKDSELRDFIIKNHLTQKEESTALIKDSITLYFNEKNEKEKLAKTLLQLRQQQNNATINTTNNRPFKNLATIAPETAPEVATDEQISFSQQDSIIIIDGEAFDVEDTSKSLDVYHEAIIKVIGEKGFSESKDIYNTVKELTHCQETTIKNKLAELVSQKIMQIEPTSTPIRKTLNLYSLSLLGKSIYQKMTNLKPVICEKDRLIQQHASIRHAYCIKDTASLLEDLGYQNVSIDSSKNSITISSNQRYVPDIIGYTSGQATYWEVELAHHTDMDFFEKLTKAAKVSNTVYIIAPDVKTSKKLKEQVNRYIQYLVKSDFTMKQTVYLGTMSQLQQRNIFSNENCKIEIDV